MWCLVPLVAWGLQDLICVSLAAINAQVGGGQEEAVVSVLWQEKGAGVCL